MWIEYEVRGGGLFEMGRCVMVFAGMKSTCGFAISLFLLLSSERGVFASSGSIPEKSFVLPVIGARVESAVTDAERVALFADEKELSTFQMDLAPTSAFGKVFKGSGGTAVVNYLSERIHFILSQKSEFQTQDKSVAREMIVDGRTQTIALNVGASVWLVRQTSQLYNKRDVEFQFDGQWIPIHSSRVGVVQLGEGFTNQVSSQFGVPSVSRQATLVHEARHSDCTGGLTREILRKVHETQSGQGLRCGHRHVACPKGHDYEGEISCDAEAWGAYSIETIFSAAISRNCTNCSVAQKTAAQMVALDSLYRVLPLKEWTEGRAGDPDMSSSDEIRD